MSTSVLDIDLPMMDGGGNHYNNFVSLADGLGGEAASATYPSLPSILRASNRRFLMERVDTTVLPDFSTLTDISYDHDLFTALGMISFDTIRGMKIGRSQDDVADVRNLQDFDEKVNMNTLYQNVTNDELRYGNSIFLKQIEDKMFIGGDVVHPGKIKDMKFGPNNKPMWWVLQAEDRDGNGEDVAYVDPKYMDRYLSGSWAITDNIAGPADQIVHFKGNALRYQAWGVGIAQIAKILVETKLDMLVDFSKIIKKEAAPKEYIYVNVQGLRDQAARNKIQQTINSVTEQRKLNNIIVLEQGDAEASVVGSEGKVMDNFTLHYRDDILRAIRILTRVPPSFWLGEATNKATINSQLTVYNGYLESIRYHNNLRFKREIFHPYLKQFDPTIKISAVPEINFMGVPIMDPMDRMKMDDMAVRLGIKSRKQTAKEWGFTMPEADGEIAPELTKQQRPIVIEKEQLEVVPDV